MVFEKQEGCLFTLNGRRYIYTGIQKNLKGNFVPTFYGLDGLDNGEKKDFTGANINDFINESNTNPKDSVLKIVKSPIYNEYKPGIPKKLKGILSLPSSAPAAFYEIPGENATPKRITTISEKEKMLDPNSPNYVYRVGTNGPSLRYVKEGKMDDVDKFIKDYRNMTLKKSIPVVVNEVSGTQSTSQESPKIPNPNNLVLLPDEDTEKLNKTKGGTTKRYIKRKRSRTYKN
jgi:hypothetical protein